MGSPYRENARVASLACRAGPFEWLVGTTLGLATTIGVPWVVLHERSGRADVGFVAPPAVALATDIVTPRGEPGYESILRVVAEHGVGVRQRCFEQRHQPPARADVVVEIEFDSGGEVRSAVGTGAPRDVVLCVQREVATWRFDGGPGRMRVPFRFVRE